ncbi:zinc finger C3HC-type protein 1-like [Ruditapes philippinarum]|uniref:zinc finger C3HC-type protein 1-like n=1 Tax=Ruditapes philippinarum TaxID=129788 RepID=UPI00295ABD9E|nr:zinc finger C3HC-type protein 1-like [Ruditapes philippinarum]
MLQCVNCKAFICGQLPKAVDTRNYRDSCNKFKKELVDGHEKLCKWSSSSCPESFLYVPYHDREELLSNFWFKMTSLQCAKIPTVSFKSIEEKGVTAESMMSYARTIASHSSSEIVASDSTIICALCGWHYSESQVDILQCNFCCRKIGLWNYQFENTEQMTPSVGSDSFKETRINGNTLTEKSNGCVCSDQSNGIHKNGSEKTNVDQNTCHVNGDPSKREGEPNDKNTNNMDGQINKINEQDLECDGPVRKRPRLEKQQFDPVSEHRYWCPWLQTGSQNIASGERLHKDTSPAGSPVKSQTTSEEREPAWLKVTKILCHRLDDGDNDSCRQLKRSPQAEGLRHLRKVLRECTSPKKPEKDLQQ